MIFKHNYSIFLIIILIYEYNSHELCNDPICSTCDLYDKDKCFKCYFGFFLYKNKCSSNVCDYNILLIIINKFLLNLNYYFNI